jgi:DNA polymerase I
VTTEELDLATWPIFYRMSKRGLLVSAERLDALKAEVGSKAEEQLELCTALGGPANPSSGDQVAAWMVANGMVGKRTEGGRLATDERSLVTHSHPVLDAVLAYRGYRKLEGTFIDPVIEIATRTGGTIHPRWRLTKVKSGRVATENPNLLAFPSRDEMGRKVRSCFVARRGYRMVSVDYSQLEPRIVAALSEDEKLVSIYANDRDLYTEIAGELVVTRQAAKVLTLGILYGMSGRRLEEQLRLSGQDGFDLEACDRLIERWFEAYPGVKRLVEETLTKARAEGGWARTVGGRGRLLPGLFLDGAGWPAGKLREEAERQAFNHLIQGTGMECLKQAMLQVDRVVPVDAHPLLAIHDELVYEVPDGEAAERYAHLIAKGCMERTFGKVLLKTSTAIADDWGSLK